MRRRIPWLVPLFGALVGVVMVASPGLASTAGTWTPTNPMELGRAFFSGTLLRDGDVLVAGGFDGSRPNVFFKSAEIYHTATGTWSPVANMHEARAAHVAVRLPGGRVMVIGGENLVSGGLDTAEIYDPRTNTWTETAPLLVGRTEDFVATLLPQAGTHTRVLVADGYGSDGSPLAESEIYDVQNNAWKPTGSLNEARGEANWVKLKSGKILVAGGCCTEDGSSLSSAELYDPATGAWTLTGSMHEGRFDLALVKLNSGNVLAAGGGDFGPGGSGYSATAEIYNTDTHVWTMTGSMTTARSEVDQSSALLPDGKVLVPGGFDVPDDPQSSSDIFDPATGTFSAAGEMSSIRAGHYAVHLLDGRILVMGGLAEEPAATPTVDIFTE